jgi:hypothetical protein
MSLHNHWRNRQLGKDILPQEKKCIDFLSRHRNCRWRWEGSKGHFFHWCQDLISLDQTQYNGLILINYPSNVSPGEFVRTIDKLMRQDIKAVYVAINRYTFRPVNDLEIPNFNDISLAIDFMIGKCEKKFQRYYLSEHVDGHHFVGVHGLDVFIYEHH